MNCRDVNPNLAKKTLIAGFKSEQVCSFTWFGKHGPMNLRQMVKRLGETIKTWNS